MRPAIDALIAGAASAIDLSPPTRATVPPEQAMAAYWVTTGAYMWRGVEAQRPLYEMQRPLFDADALLAK